MSKAPARKERPSKARGVIPMPETDVLGRDLVGESGLLELPLDTIDPDPNQARWLLPPELRAKFQAGELGAEQALERWRKTVERQVKQLGCPAADVPEARRLAEIEALAKSIRAGGQINPITVVRYGARWRIETGERRYWAHVWLWAVERDPAGRQVPAVVRSRLDVFRQAVENLHASPLNAIGIARTVARLVQALTQIPAPGQELPPLPDLAAYRQVAGARVPHGGWKRIEEAMGKTADHLARHLRLLMLPDDAILLADRNDLTEKQLRPVTELQNSQAQVRIVRLAVDLKLTSADVEWLCRQPDLDKAERELRARPAAEQTAPVAPRARFSPERVLYNRVASLARLTSSVEKGGESPAHALAQEYLAARGDAAGDELRGLIAILEQALRQVQQSQSDSHPASEL